jgi:hypothetical protein
MTLCPNPNNGIFTLELIYVTIKTTIEIYDQNEVSVFRARIIALETPVSTGLPVGTYNLKLLENNSVVGVQKLIIQ